MFDFFNRLFGTPPSSQTAKERLRLVLLSDHLSLAPDVVENLKRDLLEVISRYVEVDVANCDVSFEQREKDVAMMANIPILGMQKRVAPPTPPPAPPAPPIEPSPAFTVAAADAAVAEPVEAVKPKAPRKTAANGSNGSANTGAAANGTVANGSATPRRRRRKRPPAQSIPHPQLANGAPQPT